MLQLNYFSKFEVKGGTVCRGVSESWKLQRAGETRGLQLLNPPVPSPNLRAPDRFHFDLLASGLTSAGQDYPSHPLGYFCKPYYPELMQQASFRQKGGRVWGVLRSCGCDALEERLYERIAILFLLARRFVNT